MRLYTASGRPVLTHCCCGTEHAQVNSPVDNGAFLLTTEKLKATSNRESVLIGVRCAAAVLCYVTFATSYASRCAVQIKPKPVDVAFIGHLAAQTASYAQGHPKEAPAC